MSENARMYDTSGGTGEQRPPEETWLRIQQRLRAEIGEAMYSSWFGGFELDCIDRNVAYCSVPTKFLKSWINSQFIERITPIFTAELPDVRLLSIFERTAQRPGSARVGSKTGEASPNEKAAVPPAADAGTAAGNSDMTLRAFPAREASPSAAGKFTDVGGSTLDPRYTFESFLVGASNQLAHAAALEVTRANGATFNPLYLHAAVGLGKTHLLQAIARKAAEMRKRVLYLSAEKFMYVFVSSLKEHTTIALKEKLRSIDILIVDDVQFLQGKSVLLEFSHTLTALFEAGKQVIVAADVPPSELESLDERVRSRLSGGLCTEIKPFDDELRFKILENRIASARAAQPGFDVSQTVLAYLANALRTNGRDIEGAVNRLLAHAKFSGTKLSVESAEVAISDLVRVRDPKRIKIEDILKLVSTHYNVTKPDILSSRRTAIVVRPRQVAMYLAKTLTLRSLPEIGRRFGGRDHTTVLHAVRKIERLASTDLALREEIELLKRLLSEYYP